MMIPVVSYVHGYSVHNMLAAGKVKHIGLFRCTGGRSDDRYYSKSCFSLTRLAL